MPLKKKRRESWGIIDTLPSGRYRARYSHLGERFSAPHTFDAKEDARTWLSQQRADISRGIWTDPRTVKPHDKFGRYAEHWVKVRVTSKGKPLSPKTQAEYLRYIHVGLKQFADMDMAAITESMVRTWHAERLKVGATQAGLEARLLRAVLRTAMTDGLIQSVPVPTAHTKSSAGKKYRPPTVDELKVILTAMPDNLRLAVLIAAYAGLRISEWRCLRRKDITFREGRAWVDVNRNAYYLAGQGWVIGNTKSESGVRELSLPIGLTDAVKDHLKKYVTKSADSLLFPPERGSDFIHDSYFFTRWNVARDAAGVRKVVREHDLRGFAATQYAMSGATLREIMDFLGHATPATSLVYMHSVGRQGELSDKMNLPI